MSYTDFLSAKRPVVKAAGIEVSPEAIHPALFPHQRDLVRWALRKGRCALFADTGLGKTFMQLEWARLTGQRTLILAPLSIARQTVREAAKLPEVRIDKDPITEDQWIEWARPIWYGIRETDTLQAPPKANDERHVAPLQLGVIERCVRLWSNPGETVLTPFMGIGSEAYVALQHGRKAIGIELKPEYFATAVRNIKAARSQPSMFDGEP